MFWRAAHHKLLQYQLRCPAGQEFGMDRNPVPYFSNFMRRTEALVEAQQVGTVPATNLQLHSFLLDQLLGRAGTTANQLLGIPISWIRDSSNSQTLQAMARAVLPTANPPPAAVARMPTANTSKAQGETTNFEGFNFDWSNCHSDLQGGLDYQVALDMHRRKLLQEEIDRKQADAHPSNTLTDKTQLEDLKVDLNNLDQQGSECQRLQAEANRKPAAKKDPPKDDDNKKKPAMDRQQQLHNRSNQHPCAHISTSTGAVTASDIMPLPTHVTHPTSTKTTTDEEDEWLRNNIIPWILANDITLNNDGTFYSDSTIPPLVQQWLSRKTVPASAQRAHSHRTQTNTTTADTPTGIIPAATTTAAVPTQANHPVFTPKENARMCERGIRAVDGIIRFS